MIKPGGSRNHLLTTPNSANPALETITITTTIAVSITIADGMPSMFRVKKCLMRPWLIAWYGGISLSADFPSIHQEWPAVVIRQLTSQEAEEKYQCYLNWFWRICDSRGVSVIRLSYYRCYWRPLHPLTSVPAYHHPLITGYRYQLDCRQTPALPPRSWMVRLLVPAGGFQLQQLKPLGWLHDNILLSLPI